MLIGDDVPHPPTYTPSKINWRTEVERLGEMGIPVYGVRGRSNRHRSMRPRSTPSWPRSRGGFRTCLSLDQFASITDMVLAICYKQSSDERLQQYEREVAKQGRMNRGLNRIFNTMLRREPAAISEDVELQAVPPGRFQVLEVDKDGPIKDFVQENGLAFKTGRGFYEFTKTETVQGYKEIILMDKASGDFFEGEKARELLGLPAGETARIRPTSLEKYAVFVQSTSANRKLMGGTRFLYEVEDWDRKAEAETPSTMAAAR